jgi:hypothetical protein
MTLTVEVWERDQATPGSPTKVCDITEAWGRKFRNAKNDYGSGELNIQLSDPELAEVQPGRLVKFVRDSVVRGCVVLGARRIARVKRGEEAEQVLSVQAPGVMFVLNDGRQQPVNGANWSPWDRQRRWDYSNPELDTTSWVAATELGRQGDYVVVNTLAEGIAQLLDYGRYPGAPPEGYGDADSMWIWSSGYDGAAGTGVGDGTLNMAVGTSYFHKTFTTSADARVRLVGACDDFFEVAVDGVVLVTTGPEPEEAHSRARTRDFFLTAGTHTVRVKASNYPRVSQDGNIAGLVMAIHEVDVANDSLGAVLVRTDDTWKALDYPASAPGFTAGDILLTLLAEMQAEGFLTDVSPTFDATLDSDGGTWPILTDVVTQLGDGLGDIVRQLCETAIDSRVNHDLTWDAWIKGTAGTASGVTYAEGVNIAELELDGDTTPISSLMVIHAEGVSVLGDATSGRQQVLDLSQMTRAEAEAKGTDVLADLSDQRWAVTIQVEPAGGDVPFEDVDIFDTATVPDPAGSPATVECIAITWSEDDAGNEVLLPEFGDLVLDPGERLRRALTGALRGSAGGTTRQSSTGGSQPETVLAGGGGSYPATSSVSSLIFDRDAAATDTVSSSKRVDAAGTITEFAAELPDGAEASSVAVVLKDGATTVATATIAAGDTHAVAPGLRYTALKDSTSLSVTCTSTGFRLIATVRFA